MSNNIKKENMRQNKIVVWESSVRDYEVDFQGIVNNANYYHYLDNARTLFFRERDLDIKKCAEDGINIVLYSSQMLFRYPLTFLDKFFVTTELKKMSNLKVLFVQKIYIFNSDKICLEAESIVCAVKKHNSHPRPFVFDKLLSCID